MDYRKSMILFWVLFAAGAASGLISLILGNSALMIACVVLLLAGLLQYTVFFRCPSCGKHLDRGLPKYCPHCGEKLK